jgi:hypothetical protein
MKAKYDDHVSFGIHEVYYEEDGGINGYTEEPVGVYSNSLEGLRETLEQMLKGLDKPVLIDEEIYFSDDK